MRDTVEAYRVIEGWVPFVRGIRWPGVYETQAMALRAGTFSERQMAALMAAAPNRVVTEADMDAVLAGEAPGAIQVWDRLTRDG